MTNGEKIKEIFPNGVLTTDSNNKTYYWGCNIRVSKEYWNAEYKEPITKNDLAVECYQDLIDYFGGKEVAKTILEDRKEFKAWLERLRWYVKKADELHSELQQLKGTTKIVVTDDCISRQAVIDMTGLSEWFDSSDSYNEFVIALSELPPVIPQPTKNDLGVDCISREQALIAIRNLYPNMSRVDFNGSLRKWVDKYKPYIECDDAIKQLSSVTPQEPKKGEWLRMSDLPEQEDDRYKCSRCGNVIHHKNKMNLYTFNSWCGRCGSKNEVKE